MYAVSAILQVRRHFNYNPVYFYKSESFIQPKGIAVYHETRQSNRSNPWNGSCEYFLVQDFLLLTCLFSIRVIEFNRDSNIEALSAIVPDQSTIISDPVFNYEEKFGYFYFQRTQIICLSKTDSD
ncbi:unnamed protein product, partial [Rotaria sp. Silwood1]